VPQDFNLAERSLRKARRNEKLVGRAPYLDLDTANLLSVVQTCRRQGRSVISFFACALRAHVGHIGAFLSCPFSDLNPYN